MHKSAFFRPPGSGVDYLVPLLAQRGEIVARAHLMGHFGIASTISRLRLDFRVFWHGMLQAVEQFVKSCAMCLQYQLRPAPQHNARSLNIPGLFHRVSMDLVLGLPTTEEGYKGILVITEYLSKYPVVFPIKEKSAKEIAPLFFHYVSTFGAPQEVLSDQGTEFVNDP